MDYHGIKMEGPFVMETGNIPLSAAPSDKKRIMYDPSDEKVYFAPSPSASSNWIQLSENFGEIPENTIMLFMNDTQLTGYTLLTDIDDEVVYIARNEAEGSTTVLENYPTHTHNYIPHFHTLGSHDHPINGETDTYEMFRINESGGGDWQALQFHFHTFSGTTSSVAGGNTGYNATGVTGPSVTPWKPKGRNFTRQQRTS
jgi:hypothetical protein